MRELRFAARTLLRAPGFALLTICTLALGIGANAGIFSVIDTVLLDPLPFADNDRLVYIGGSAPGSDFPEEFGLATEFMVEYREQSKHIEDVAIYNSFTSTLRVDDRVERIRMSAPTPSLFTTLGAVPLLGRLPTVEDESGVVVLSHQLWSTWFGQDPDILGRVIYVSGEDREVIGVMPDSFWFPSDSTLLWFPNVIPEDLEPGRFGRPMVARLAPGTDHDALLTELDGLAARLPERYGGTANYTQLIEQLVTVVRPLRTELLGDISKSLWILLGSMGILFLIACANVANLFMVRAERRRPDQAVRQALGAGRGRLMGHQMAEAVWVALFSGILATLLAYAVVPILIRVAPSRVPRLADVSVGPETGLFIFCASALAALLCGALPALRFSSLQLSMIREGGRSLSRRRHFGRDALVAAQTALALVLLIGSALLAQSFHKLRHVDPGYDTEDRFTFQIAPVGPHLEDAPSYARFHLDFMQRVAALPGVESVGIVNNVPLDEGLASRRFRTEETAGEEDAGPILRTTFAAGDYFQTMNISVLQGRTFTESDHFTQLGNILVSQSAAEQMWPGQDPIGKRLQMEGREEWEAVIGVVDDVRQFGFRQAAEPMVYFPLVGQNPENSRPVASPGYVVKTRRAEQIAPEIRALVKEVAPMAPMYRTYTMDFLAERSMVQLTFTAMTLGITALLAFLLGCIGLYGSVAYAVAERTREIGLRMALGARAFQVRSMVLAQGAVVLLIGLGIGVAVALPGSKVLQDLLFNTDTFDGTIYLAVCVLVFAVGLSATWMPAVRASQVDPMECLRAD